MSMPYSFTPRTLIKIDQKALQANYARVKSLAPQSKILAMVKANGYGHGLLCVAQNIPYADGFGVATCDEALMLRDHGFKQKIVLISGVQNANELIAMSAANIDIVVHHAHQMDLLKQVALPKPVQVWLNIDTGMHRLGFSPEAAMQAYSALQQLDTVQAPIHLLTHFASADWDRQTTQSQIQRFNQFASQFSEPCSLANSAGVLNWPQAHGEWVRPGIMLYGISPMSNKTGAEFGLKPVMTLMSRLIAIKTVDAGESVGYHHTWRAPETMPIGIVGIGYGDGYPWQAPNGTPVHVRGQCCPLIGRVSMDFLAIDLRPLEVAHIGDAVILWGSQLPVEMVANHVGLTPYTLLTSVGIRAPTRQYVKQSHSTHEVFSQDEVE